ncbi:MAG TPA: DsbA family oxidoreductase [Beijerinckiaceae bacterium]|jgi:predicted DsbA family dithiol-disulfide isomerase
MEIAVFSDVICPWCYIGKRRLERAFEALGLKGRVAVEWLPFELNPGMPREGMARADYRAQKFGAERAAALDANIRAVGAEEGIRFAFDRQSRTPNTRAAHMLIAHASGQGRGGAVVDALFRAYFEEGRDIGDEAVLLAVAEEAGLPRDEAQAALRDQEVRRMVVQAEGRAGELGISGVPFFIVDQAFAVSGAQPAEAWVEALQQIAARRPAGGRAAAGA